MKKYNTLYIFKTKYKYTICLRNYGFEYIIFKEHYMNIQYTNETIL